MDGTIVNDVDVTGSVVTDIVLCAGVADPVVTTIVCCDVTTDGVVCVDVCGGDIADGVVCIDVNNSVVGEIGCIGVAVDIVSTDPLVCVGNAFPMDCAVCVDVVTDPRCVGVVL